MTRHLVGADPVLPICRKHQEVVLEYNTNSVVVQPCHSCLCNTVMLGCLCGQEFGLLLINQSFPTKNITILGSWAVAPHDNLVSQNHDDIQRDTEVGSDEVLVIEIAI